MRQTCRKCGQQVQSVFGAPIKNCLMCGTRLKVPHSNGMYFAYLVMAMLVAAGMNRRIMADERFVLYGAFLGIGAAIYLFLAKKRRGY